MASFCVLKLPISFPPASTITKRDVEAFGSELLGLSSTKVARKRERRAEVLSFDNTCTCHRSSVASYIADLLHDRTLRDGDLVMTAKGFRVFKGDKSGVVQPSNFVALSPSSSVAKASGAELKAMESAGIWDRQYRPYSYSAPAAETKQTLIAVRRPHKGIDTVDDGDANP